MPNTGPPILVWPTWSDNAAIISATEVAGFEATQLQRIQPSDRWHTPGLEDARMVLDRTIVDPFNVASFLYGNLTEEATIGWDFADTEAELDTSPVHTNHFGFHSGMVLDGTQQLLGVAAAWVPVNNLTLELIIRPSVIQRCGILRFGALGSPAGEAWIGMRSDGRIQFYDPVPGANGLVISTTAAQVGVRMHIACVYDDAADSTRIYIDGVLEGTTTGVTSFQTNPDSMHVGQQDGGNRYAGFVDDIRLWDDVRTGPEIEAARHAELVGTEPNLVSYWDFNIAKGTTVPEKSGGMSLTHPTGFGVWSYPESYWASPALDIYPRRHSLLFHADGVSARFARPHILDPNNPEGRIRAGRLVIGNGWQLSGTGGRRFGGGPMGITDLGSRKDTPGGNIITKRRGIRSTSRFTMVMTDESQAKIDSRAIEYQRGGSRDVLAILEPYSDLYRHGSMIYGLMGKTQELLDTDFGIFERSYAIEEMI